VEVYNSSGTQTAGINGNTGVVFGNLKSFIVPDPTDSERMIQYTSLEGPEAAIYVRGTSDLDQGLAHIDLPDHFSAMAVPNSITVTLTPRSQHSAGLAAVEVDGAGIEVRELGGGVGSYRFDYVVYAVRKGYEDYEVYVNSDEATEVTGQARSLVKAMATSVQPSASRILKRALASEK